jgi:Pyridoxamine 5'-phosphate oxidase
MRNRPISQRVADAKARLRGDTNVWLATASTEGVPHLVPLSLAWLDEHVVVATPSASPTARNATTAKRARLALDSTDDVVIVDADAKVVALDDADPQLIARYAQRVGWDPREESGSWSVLVLSPRRVQSWNGPSEIDGRTIMREGRWLDD